MDTPAVVVNKATFSTMGLCLSEEKEKHYDGHPHKISQRRRSSNRELLDGRRHYDNKTAMDTKPQSTAFTKPAPSSLQQQQQQAPVVAATQTDHSVSTTAASGCIT